MDKYSDNRLAEELDLIVLTTNRYKESGFQRGTVGTLIYSYTGLRRPMYGEFKSANKRTELSLRLRDFRVLNPFSQKDIRHLSNHLKNQQSNRKNGCKKHSRFLFTFLSFAVFVNSIDELLDMHGALRIEIIGRSAFHRLTKCLQLL